MTTKEKIHTLIRNAEDNIRDADDKVSSDLSNKYSLRAIAKSLTAIAKMFASDYEKSFSDDEPVKPSQVELFADGESVGYDWVCGVCGSSVTGTCKYPFKFCPGCGRKVGWEEES